MNGTSAHASTNGYARHAADEEVKRELSDDELYGEDHEEDGQMPGVSDRPVIHEIETDGSCVHEVAVPVNEQYVPLRNRTAEEHPAKQYSFPNGLDRLQQEAISCIDNHRSVLLCAPQSAGKTSVAMYAVALGLQQKQRVIYTTPVDALVNQLYRALCEEFRDDIGLVTGNESLNEEAGCLVVSMEVLRKLLYAGDEKVREVGWVVVDGVHHMSDKERGQICEEVITLFSPSARFVLLSKPAPNATNFGEWICYIHHQPCHIVRTDQRPLAQQHFVYSSGSDGLYEVVDIDGTVKDCQLQLSTLAVSSTQPARSNRRVSRADGDVAKLVRTFRERDMLSCIVFTYSRHECEAHAGSVRNMDFNTDEEKTSVKNIVNDTSHALAEEDRRLPQITGILQLLMRGVGIFHDGMLPYLRELTEILFSEGLVKVVFTTDVSVVGSRMLARTVIITSARKFDGSDHRWLSSEEYDLMRSRAGRRGRDDRGFVITITDQAIPPAAARQIFRGPQEPIKSHFRVTYHTIINAMRMQLSPRDILERSFGHFEQICSFLELRQKLTDARQAVENCVVDRESEIKSYFAIEKELESLNASIRKRILQPRHLEKFFHPGRLLKFRIGDVDFGWGALVKHKKKPIIGTSTTPGDLLYIIDMAVFISPESARTATSAQQLRPAALGQEGMIAIVAFSHKAVTAISDTRVKLPDNLMSAEGRNCLAQILENVIVNRMHGEVPELDPIKHMGIEDIELRQQMARVEQLEKNKEAYPLRKRADFDAIHADYARKLRFESEYKAAKEAIAKAKCVPLHEEISARMRVLRVLQYCDERNILTQKGKAACEISVADNVLVTEMLHGLTDASFASMPPHGIAALFSCLVLNEPVPDKTPRLTDELSSCYFNVQRYARGLVKQELEAKLTVDEAAYVAQFKQHMMEAAQAWDVGASFRDISQGSELFEGTMIRCLRRLETLLREMTSAAEVIGNFDLAKKFEQARASLKHDIVFSASLYF